MGETDEGSRFSELRTQNPELRIAPFSHVARFPRHSLMMKGGMEP